MSPSATPTASASTAPVVGTPVDLTGRPRFEHLARPFDIGGVRIKNRFTMAPMAMGMMVGPQGEFTDAAIEYYARRAQGGFGLLVTGALFVDNVVDAGGPTPLDNPAPFLRQAGELIERTGAFDTVIFPQVSMGLGRNAAGQHAPSAIADVWDPSSMHPGLTKDQIRTKVDLVVGTCALLKQAGFRGVEVHALHWGYLLDQFAMSILNHREDEYGGTLENRLLPTREIVQGIKQVCGDDFAVQMRLGLKSYITGLGQASLTGEDEAGRTLEEGVRIAKLLEDYGYDALNVDVGIYDSFYQALPPIYMPRGHVIPLAAEARKAVSIPVICGSRMGDPVMDEQAIADGRIDAVALARPALADPDFPLKTLVGTPERIRPCIACNVGCFGELMAGRRGTCAVNPACGRELTFGVTPALQRRRVAVVGGGVAGMEAARVAALRGHSVTLYEAGPQLGGVVIPGGAHTFKKEMGELVDWYRQELAHLDAIDVRLGTAVTVDTLADDPAGAPDAVVLALGSEPNALRVPGIEDAPAMSGIDALLHPERLGQRVVVIGGGYVGCEIAIGAAQDGHEVTVVEALPDILSAGGAVPVQNSMMIRTLLDQEHVTVLTGQGVASADASGVTVSATGTGAQQAAPVHLDADSIVVSVGYHPRASFASELVARGIEVHEVGDGRRVGTVSTSVTDAYAVARTL